MGTVENKSFCSWDHGEWVKQSCLKSPFWYEIHGIWADDSRIIPSGRIWNWTRSSSLCWTSATNVWTRWTCERTGGASRWSLWDPLDCPSRGLHQDVQQIFLETPKKKQVDDGGWAVGHVSAGFRKAFFFFFEVAHWYICNFWRSTGTIHLLICLFTYLFIDLFSHCFCMLKQVQEAKKYKNAEHEATSV